MGQRVDRAQSVGVDILYTRIKIANHMTAGGTDKQSTRVTKGAYEARPTYRWGHHIKQNLVATART